MAKKNKVSKREYKKLASKGRGGDTELAHVNPAEKAILKSLGGSGTINPKTGLREYVAPLLAAIPMVAGAGGGAAAAGGGAAIAGGGAVAGGGLAAGAAGGASAATGGGMMAKMGGMAQKQGMSKLAQGGGKKEEGGGKKKGGGMMKSMMKMAQDPSGTVDGITSMGKAKPTMSPADNKAMLENVDKMNRGTGFYTGNEATNRGAKIRSKKLGVDKFMTGLAKASAISTAVSNTASGMGIMGKGMGKKSAGGAGGLNSLATAGKSSKASGGSKPADIQTVPDVTTPQTTPGIPEAGPVAPTATKTQPLTDPTSYMKKANTLKMGADVAPPVEIFPPTPMAKKGLNLKAKRAYKKTKKK